MQENTSIPNYSAEDLDNLFSSGILERLGMGSRRACYKIPGMSLCAICYWSDEEIKEELRLVFKLTTYDAVREYLGKWIKSAQYC